MLKDNSKQGGPLENFMYDELFDEPNDLFFTDDGSVSEGSKDSSGDYMTEQAQQNDIASVCSISERASHFLKHIYVELLRVIKPLELADSYRTPTAPKSNVN